MAITMLRKIWDHHLVEAQTDDCPAVLYIDFHLVNEVTSPQAFSLLEARGLAVARPERTLATIDHATPPRRPDAEGWRPYVSQQAHVRPAEKSGCQRFVK
ncbi:aconitase family protein [Paraburkholderia hospita]|uniref:aconitase family protein n=1 Tax=Paraburkholderia hospita TaxID=169430 RepID=UPI003ECEE938